MVLALFFNSPLSYWSFLLACGILKCESAVTATGLSHSTPKWPDSCLSFISSESPYSISRDRGEMKKSLRTGQGDSDYL